MSGIRSAQQPPIVEGHDSNDETEPMQMDNVFSKKFDDYVPECECEYKHAPSDIPPRLQQHHRSKSANSKRPHIHTENDANHDLLTSLSPNLFSDIPSYESTYVPAQLYSQFETERLLRKHNKLLKPSDPVVHSILRGETSYWACLGELRKLVVSLNKDNEALRHQKAREINKRRLMEKQHIRGVNQLQATQVCILHTYILMYSSMLHIYPIPTHMYTMHVDGSCMYQRYW